MCWVLNAFLFVPLQILRRDSGQNFHVSDIRICQTVFQTIFQTVFTVSNSFLIFSYFSCNLKMFRIESIRGGPRIAVLKHIQTHAWNSWATSWYSDFDNSILFDVYLFNLSELTFSILSLVLFTLKHPCWEKDVI